MTTIYDSFLKKLINLKNYTILSEKASYLILITKIKLPIDVNLKSSLFQSYTGVKEMNVQFVFVLEFERSPLQDSFEGREFEKDDDFYELNKLKNARLPILQITQGELMADLPEKDIEEMLQDFIVKTVDQRIKFRNNLTYKDLAFLN